jgi:hypothetical protein
MNEVAQIGTRRCVDLCETSVFSVVKTFEVFSTAVRDNVEERPFSAA